LAGAQGTILWGAGVVCTADVVELLARLYRCRILHVAFRANAGCVITTTAAIVAAPGHASPESLAQASEATTASPYPTNAMRMRISASMRYHS
jgi:hypothetical protein